MIRPARAITTILAVAMLGVPLATTVAAAPPVPHAGPAQPRRFSDAIRGLPADVDVVLACRSLAKLRDTAAASFVVESLAADALDPVREGWGELARTIGLAPEQAFDAVFGDRVVLALRRVDGRLPDWTIQTHVTAKTESLLRERLKVVPRTIVAGQTLYAVERGALELSVARSADKSGPARIVLAPAGSALFEDVLRAKPGSSSIVDTPVGRAIHAAPPGDVLVLARLRERADAWGALVGSVDPTTFTATVRGALSHERPGAADTPGWDEAQVRDVASRALVAVFDSRASALAEVGDVLVARLPERVRAALERDESLTGREVMLLTVDPSGDPALLAGIEMRDLDSGARAADEAMDAMLETSGVAPRRFDGLAPRAVRTVDEPPVSVAWMYAPAQDDATAGRVWWIHTTAPDCLDAGRAEFTTLVQKADGLRAFASVRPALLARSLTAVGEHLPAAASAMERIESIEWVEIDAPEKVLDARLVVRFVEPARAR